MKNISTLILAAGKGVRMKSHLPKVLHPLGEKSLVERVCDTHQQLKPKQMAAIVGHQSELVKKQLKPKFSKVKFFKQKRLDGSGGAVRAALPWLRKLKGDVLVVCGDAPLIRFQTLKTLAEVHRREKNGATVLTMVVNSPKGYGRILRRPGGAVSRIVEELDATNREREINEVNTGTYCFNAKALAALLPKLSNKNAKKEYYLTDILELMNRVQQRVGAVVCEDADEAVGINSRVDLALAQQILFRRKAHSLMAQGVTLIDPDSTYIEESVKIGANTIIWPQTIIRGQTKIGGNCEIGPWTHIIDAKIENDAKIKASFVESALIQRGAKVGPFSRVRPKSIVGPDVHLGNFSEVKNAHLKKGSKVNHLSYLGDAKVGKNVNIGAGTITCNYDGIHKHPTVIQDHAFIGSNVNLIAPIKVGSHSVVGAGSSLSRDVPAWSLAVERAPSKTKKNWAKRRKKSKKR